MQRRTAPTATKNHRIFADHAPSPVPDRESGPARPRSAPTTATATPACAAAVPTVVEEPALTPQTSLKEGSSPQSQVLDSAILSMIDAPVAPGETIRDAFHRKEDRLLALFGGMTTSDALTMHRRLANPSPHARSSGVIIVNFTPSCSSAAGTSSPTPIT